MVVHTHMSICSLRFLFLILGVDQAEQKNSSPFTFYLLEYFNQLATLVNSRKMYTLTVVIVRNDQMYHTSIFLPYLCYGFFTTWMLLKITIVTLKKSICDVLKSFIIFKYFLRPPLMVYCLRAVILISF